MGVRGVENDKNRRVEKRVQTSGHVRVNFVPSHNFICLSINCFETNKIM